MEKIPVADGDVKYIRRRIKKAISKLQGIEWDVTKNQLPKEEFVRDVGELAEEFEDYFEVNDLINAINCILIFCKQSGNLEESDYWARFYFYVVSNKFGVFSIQMADVLEKRSLIFLQQGDLALSEEYCEQALALRGMLLPEEHPDLIRSLSHKATIHQARGNSQTALILYGRVLKLKAIVYGNRSVEVAKTCKDLAKIYTDLDEGIAEELFKEAWLIFLQHYGDELTINYAITLKNLAVLYVKQERYIEAEYLFLKAIKGFREQLSENDARIGLAFMDFADYYMKQGFYIPAQAILNEVLKFFLIGYGDDSVFTALCRSNLGSCLRKQGLHTEADKYFEQSDLYFQNKSKATKKAVKQFLKEQLKNTSTESRDAIKRILRGQEASQSPEELENFYLEYPETRYSHAQALEKIVQLEIDKGNLMGDTETEQTS
jgi:Tetratricopeptide repeat